MGSTGTRHEVDRVLGADLAELAGSGPPSSHSPPGLANWHLPEAGKTALRDHGLPVGRTDDLLGVASGIQLSDTTEPGPGGRRLYALATYGTSRLAAVEHSGEVLVVPASGELPVTMVNSTIVALVECAWRWHGLLPLLADEQRRAGEAEMAAWKEGRLDGSTPDPYAGYQELCALVLRRFREIDPAVGDDVSFWRDVIVDVW